MSSGPRHCQYCPAPNPDKCIRTRPAPGGDDIHIYAHAACAEERNIPTLYTILTPSPRAGEPQ